MNAIDPDVVTQFETETWSRCAESYLETFAVLTRQGAPLLIKAAKIGAGDRVLDLGAGPGHLAEALSDAGATVSAVDFSKQMVAVAGKRFPDLDVRQANAEDLPFENDAFDAVVANFVVHHLARPEVVFAEVSRVLKPGGHFAFVVWGTPEEQTSIGAFFAAVMAHQDVDDLPHGPLFGVTDKATYDALAKAGDMAGLELTRHRLDWESDSLDPIIRAYWDWGNIHALPRDTQDKIEASVRNNAAAYKNAAGYVFPHSVILGVATIRKPS